MILSGHEIRQQLGTNIVIDPFDEERLNPNSYNLTLHHELMTYEEVVLDMRKPTAAAASTFRPKGWCSAPTSFTWAARWNGPRRTTWCR